MFVFLPKITPTKNCDKAIELELIKRNKTVAKVGFKIKWLSLF